MLVGADVAATTVAVDDAVAVVGDVRGVLTTDGSGVVVASAVADDASVSAADDGLSSPQPPATSSPPATTMEIMRCIGSSLPRSFDAVSQTRPREPVDPAHPIAVQSVAARTATRPAQSSSSAVKRTPPAVRAQR